MQTLGSDAARFHLQDGSPLVFRTIPRSVVRRHVGEIVLALMLGAVGLVAATLLAKSRPEPSRASRTPSTAPR
jgi:hypothetical protein